MRQMTLNRNKIVNEGGKMIDYLTPARTEREIMIKHSKIPWTFDGAVKEAKANPT